MKKIVLSIIVGIGALTPTLTSAHVVHLEAAPHVQRWTSPQPIFRHTQLIESVTTDGHFLAYRLFGPQHCGEEFVGHGLWVRDKECGTATHITITFVSVKNRLPFRFYYRIGG